MNGTTLAYIVMGLGGFALGAYTSATDEKTMGIVFMAAGLAFQVLALRALKKAREKDLTDAPR
ncbi:MAG: hypothetical protein AAGL68_11765 [Pseudomonadota bacterium]